MSKKTKPAVKRSKKLKAPVLWGYATQPKITNIPAIDEFGNSAQIVNRSEGSATLTITNMPTLADYGTIIINGVRYVKDYSQ